MGSAATCRCPSNSASSDAAKDISVYVTCVRESHAPNRCTRLCLSVKLLRQRKRSHALIITHIYQG